VAYPDQRKKSSRFDYLFLTIKIAASAGAILWLASAVQWDIIFDKAVVVDWTILGLSFIVYSIWVLPCALRWKQITALCGYPITMGESMRGYLIGAFFSAFLPTGKGGDVVRGVLTARHHGLSLGGVLATIFVERFIGFTIALFFLLFSSLLVISSIAALKNVLISGTVLALFIMTMVLICTNPMIRKYLLIFAQKIPISKLRNAANDIFKVFDICTENPMVMLSTLGFSILNQLVLILSGYVMGFAIAGFNAPWYSFPIVIPLGFIAVLLPSIGGYGIREAGFVIFFGWFGVEKEAVVVYAVLQLLFFWGFSLIGAYFFVSRKT